jgi:hypothetical protein
MVGAGRIELPTSWSQTRRPTAGPRPVLAELEMLLKRGNGTPGENRTLVSGSGGQHSIR